MGAKLALRDGRTTILDLEWGAFGTTIDKWYKSREGNFRCNYGMASSHEAARAIVLDGFTPEHGDCLDGIKSRANSGWTATKPTLEQGNEILKVLDAGLQAGGIGCASTVGYMREGVSAREIYEMTKLAAAYGRTTAMHFRGTPGAYLLIALNPNWTCCVYIYPYLTATQFFSLLTWVLLLLPTCTTGTEVAEVNGIQELLANAAALGAPAIACHFNNPGYNLVHELIVNMQKRGMNVWGELYPVSTHTHTRTDSDYLSRCHVLSPLTRCRPPCLLASYNSTVQVVQHSMLSFSKKKFGSRNSDTATKIRLRMR